MMRNKIKITNKRKQRITRRKQRITRRKQRITRRKTTCRGGGNDFYRTRLSQYDPELLSFEKLKNLTVEYEYNLLPLYKEVSGSLDCVRGGQGVTQKYFEGNFLGAGREVSSKKIYTRDSDNSDKTKNITSFVSYDIEDVDKQTKHIFIFLLCAKKGYGKQLLDFVKEISLFLQLKIKLQPVYEYGNPNTKLVKFYTDNGFSPPDEDHNMIYTPPPLPN
jgi:hypothetical protein